jgi:hypothetical protein
VTIATYRFVGDMSKIVGGGLEGSGTSDVIEIVSVIVCVAKEYFDSCFGKCPDSSVDKRRTEAGVGSEEETGIITGVTKAADCVIGVNVLKYWSPVKARTTKFVANKKKQHNNKIRKIEDCILFLVLFL